MVGATIIVWVVVALDDVTVPLMEEPDSDWFDPDVDVPEDMEPEPEPDPPNIDWQV